MSSITDCMAPPNFVMLLGIHPGMMGASKSHQGISSSPSSYFTDTPAFKLGGLVSGSGMFSTGFLGGLQAGWSRLRGDTTTLFRKARDGDGGSIRQLAKMAKKDWGIVYLLDRLRDLGTPGVEDVMRELKFNQRYWNGAQLLLDEQVRLGKEYHRELAGHHFLRYANLANTLLLYWKQGGIEGLNSLVDLKGRFKGVLGEIGKLPDRAERVSTYSVASVGKYNPPISLEVAREFFLRSVTLYCYSPVQALAALAFCENEKAERMLEALSEMRDQKVTRFMADLVLRSKGVSVVKPVDH